MSEIVKVKYKEYLEKEVLIDLLAQRIARLQVLADYEYYVKEEATFSNSYLLISDELKELSQNLGIAKEVLIKANKIYDFNNRSKAFIPDKEYITKRMQELTFIRNINNYEE